MPEFNDPDVMIFQRSRLCNHVNASAVAAQITETTGQATVIVDTGTAIQPFRVLRKDQSGANDSIIAEVTLDAVAAKVDRSLREAQTLRPDPEQL